MENKYFELLKLKNDGKQFSTENRAQLARYEARIFEHFRWKEKDTFIESLVSMLENKIDIDTYINQLYELENLVNKSKNLLLADSEKLQTFEPDPRSEGFGVLIENLFSDIRVFEPDTDLRTEDEISEKILRKGAKEFLGKIQEY